MCLFGRAAASFSLCSCSQCLDYSLLSRAEPSVSVCVFMCKQRNTGQDTMRSPSLSHTESDSCDNTPVLLPITRKHPLFILQSIRWTSLTHAHLTADTQLDKQDPLTLLFLLLPHCDLVLRFHTPSFPPFVLETVILHFLLTHVNGNPFKKRRRRSQKVFWVFFRNQQHGHLF